MSCSSVTFLFTTSRMRCVPASGANVRPVARTLRISSSRLVEAVRAQRRHAERDTLGLELRASRLLHERRDAL
jgi:hypothetical protein